MLKEKSLKVPDSQLCLKGEKILIWSYLDPVKSYPVNCFRLVNSVKGAFAAKEFGGQP